MAWQSKLHKQAIELAFTFLQSPRFKVIEYQSRMIDEGTTYIIAFKVVRRKKRAVEGNNDARL
jgi:hypothetical protein